MTRAILLFAAVGLGIGLAWPSAEPKPPIAAAASPGEVKETVIERESNGHFYVYAKVNGELVRFLVDTGASGVALTTEDAQRVGLQFSPNEFEDIGSGASGVVRGKLVRIKEMRSMARRSRMSRVPFSKARKCHFSANPISRASVRCGWSAIIWC